MSGYGEKPYVYTISRRAWRRKRVSQGEDFDQSEELAALETAKRASLVYCRECHKFKPWAKLGIGYEKRGTDLVRTWWCDDCGNMVKEDNMEEV
jgi:RNase P subunit RPR2